MMFGRPWRIWLCVCVRVAVVVETINISLFYKPLLAAARRRMYSTCNVNKKRCSFFLSRVCSELQPTNIALGGNFRQMGDRGNFFLLSWRPVYLPIFFLSSARVFAPFYTFKKHDFDCFSRSFLHSLISQRPHDAHVLLVPRVGSGRGRRGRNRRSADPVQASQTHPSGGSSKELLLLLSLLLLEVEPRLGLGHGRQVLLLLVEVDGRPIVGRGQLLLLLLLLPTAILLLLKVLLPQPLLVMLLLLLLLLDVHSAPLGCRLIHHGRGGHSWKR